MSKLRRAAQAVVRQFGNGGFHSENTRALADTIGILSEALSEPDARDRVVEAAVAISHECCHYAGDNTCYLESILDEDETACPFDRHICATVRAYESEGGE